MARIRSKWLNKSKFDKMARHLFQTFFPLSLLSFRPLPRSSTLATARSRDRMQSTSDIVSLSPSLSRSTSSGYGLGLGLPNALDAKRSASLPSPRSSPLESVTINLPGAFSSTGIQPTALSPPEIKTKAGDFERGLGLIGMGRSGEGLSDAEENYWSDSDSDGGIMITSKGRRRISLRNTWESTPGGSEASSEEPELSYSPSSDSSASSSNGTGTRRRGVKGRVSTGNTSSGDFSHLLQFIDFTLAPQKPTPPLKLPVEIALSSSTSTLGSPNRTDFLPPISSPISNLDSEIDSPHSSLDSIISAFPSQPIASTSTLHPPADDPIPPPTKVSILARTRPIRSDASREEAYNIATRRAAYHGDSATIIKLRQPRRRLPKIPLNRLTVSSYLPLSALRSSHHSTPPASPTLAQIRDSIISNSTSSSTRTDEFLNKGKKSVRFFFDPSEEDVRDHLRLIGREEAHENLIDMWNSSNSSSEVEERKNTVTASSFFGSLFGRAVGGRVV